MQINTQKRTGRIVRNAPAPKKYVDGATLLSPHAENDVSASADHLHMTYDELSAHNVRQASDLTLLRERARDLNAQYVRLWRCFSNNPVKDYLCAVQEGEGDDASRAARLRTSISLHVERIEVLRAQVLRNAEAKRRWKRASRSSGKLVKEMRARSQAVVTELARRQESSGKGVREIGNINAEAKIDSAGGASSSVSRAAALSDNNNGAPLTSLPLFPAVYAEDVRRIEREMAMEEAGLSKPSTGEKIIAARTRAWERGDIEGVSAADRRIQKRQSTRRAARHRRKGRKRELNQYCRELDQKNRTPDPPSGDEGSSRA